MENIESERALNNGTLGTNSREEADLHDYGFSNFVPCVLLLLIGVILFLPILLSQVLATKKVNVSDYSYPKPFDLQSSNRRIAIIGTNDIHGHAYGFPMRNLKTNQEYLQGGLTFMGSIIRGMMEDWRGNLLWLDGGDQFKGGIQSSSSVSNGIIMVQFFKSLNLTFSSVGKQQFSNGLQFLDSYLKNSKQVFLAANLRVNDLSAQFAKILPSSIVTMENQLKLGVIGLTGTKKTLIPSFAQIQLLDYKQIVIKQASQLRKKGANSVIIVANAGVNCQNYISKSQIWYEKFSKNKVCTNQEIAQLIRSLPQGTVDAVVGGGNHRTAHQFINEVPVIHSKAGGRQFNIIYLDFDNSGKKIGSVIQGPIPVCSKVYSENKQCPFYNSSQADSYGQLKQYWFHSRKVQADPAITQIFNKYLQSYKPFRQQLINSMIRLQVSKTQQNSFGNLVADFLTASTKTDFSFVSPDSFRASIQPGIVLLADLYRVFPNSNKIITFDISGQQLKQLIKVLQRGSEGFYQTSGLRQIINSNSKQVVQLKLYNGSSIQNQAVYKCAAMSQIINQRQFQQVLATITPKNLKQNQGLFIQRLRDWLISLKTIEKELVDRKNLRLKSQ